MFNRNGDYVSKTVETATQSAELPNYKPYRLLRVTTGDGQVVNDGNDTETVTISVVDGLEVVRGTLPDTATVLDVNNTATVEIDGSTISVDVTGGSGTKDVTTTKSAGSTISVKAVGLDGVPAEADSTGIEVVSA